MFFSKIMHMVLADTCKIIPYKLIVALVFVLTVGTGLAWAGNDSDDPIEFVNRPIHYVNNVLDEYIGEPVSRFYIDYTPDAIRLCISNFFDHITYPNVVLNDFLQGKGGQGLEDSGRFLMNTTFGAFGLFDVATPMGLKAHNEDFGQTLAVWGLGQGPYLVLPLVGPNTIRKVPDLGVSVVTNILFYLSNPVAIPVAVLGIVDRRSRFDQAIRFRNETAVEPYLFTREAYLQHRNFLIHDGNPPIEDDDLFLDESFVKLELEGKTTEIVESEKEPSIQNQPFFSQTKNTREFSGPSSLTISVQ